MTKQITYLRLWKVFLTVFNEIDYIVELDIVDDTLILNEIVENKNLKYIVVTAVTKQVAEYKAHKIIGRMMP